MEEPSTKRQKRAEPVEENGPDAPSSSAAQVAHVTTDTEPLPNGTAQAAGVGLPQSSDASALQQPLPQPPSQPEPSNIKSEPPDQPGSASVPPQLTADTPTADAPPTATASRPTTALITTDFNAAAAAEPSQQDSHQHLPLLPPSDQPQQQGLANGKAGNGGVGEADSAAPQPDETVSPTQQVAPLLSASNGAYTQREEYLIKAEAAGEMAFKYVVNDGQPHNSIWLIALKNIFSKQLPNMPREYIARLVLDRRHRSVAIVRRRMTVVGGITYRAFREQGFGEIAFCAITANEQVKGFGTRLMNYTKEYAKTQDGLGYFLTYADNNAVGYFLKQGFTKEITLDKDRWLGYIKDYDGGTLMECVLQRALPYTALPVMIRAQRQALDTRIRGLSRSHIIHPGLQHFSQGGADRPPLDIASIPGVREGGWVAEEEAGPQFALLLDAPRGVHAVTPANLTKFMAQALRALQTDEDAWPFLESVSEADVPDYYQIIKDPVALDMIEQRLKRGNFYLTLDIFAADVKRMFANARIYNAADTVYYKLASKMETAFEQYLHSHLVFDHGVL